MDKSTNKSGLRRHVGFTENFRGADESESRLQYLSAVLLTGRAYDLTGNFENFGWKVNGKVTFREFQPKIEEHVLR